MTLQQIKEDGIKKVYDSINTDKNHNIYVDKDKIESLITKVYEQGRQSVFDELEEENKKLLQGSAYKKS